MSSLTTELFEMLKYTEDTSDPHQKAKHKCVSNCDVIAAFKKYKACQERVEAREETAETCSEDLIDMVEGINKCAGFGGFNKLV